MHIDIFSEPDQEGKIEYEKYDSVEIVKVVRDYTLRIRGFLNCSLWITEGGASKTQNLDIINSQKGVLRIVFISGVCSVLSCRVVLFEKYIMDESKIKRPVKKMALRRPRKRVW